MKREEKNFLSKQRILDAALQEFSQKGYEAASLNTICAENGISKGIIYHYFKDKDELYLICVENCFNAITSYLKKYADNLSGSVQKRLQGYFDARLGFFAEHPQYLGIFADAAFNPTSKLASEISKRRYEFDNLNISVLTELLKSEPLREGISVDNVVEDFRMYMDYFNLHFKSDFRSDSSVKNILQKHEERCHRQLDILLYGVLGENNGK